MQENAGKTSVVDNIGALLYLPYELIQSFVDNIIIITQPPVPEWEVDKPVILYTIPRKKIILPKKTAYYEFGGILRPDVHTSQRFVPNYYDYIKTSEQLENVISENNEQ